MTLAEVARLIPNVTLKGDARACFTSVSTDTRTIREGALFFALRGERFDAHDFVAEAVQCGAAMLVVERPVEAEVPQLIVPDSKRALGLAAAGWRARFDLPLIAVTGSNGKTTVTQMIAAILAAEHGERQRLATRGNLNNEIGLPLMLFELNAEHQAAVLELGMNHVGEIGYLAQLAQPTVALVNNAQREHQEFMGTVEATAHENGAVISALPQHGIAVFPSDDACAGIWRQLAGARQVLDFARRGRGKVTAQCRLGAEGTELSMATPAGSIELTLRLTGEHNIHNALAATAAALAVSVSPVAIQEGLESFTPVAGRGVRLRTASGAYLIDDTYNANPDSVRAAIEMLAQQPHPRVLLLGDMGEVGSQGVTFHREVGSYARERSIDILLAIGELCAETVASFNESGDAGGRHFVSIEALTEAARTVAVPESTLLAKGSRFMRMERVVEALKAQD